MVEYAPHSVVCRYEDNDIVLGCTCGAIEVLPAQDLSDTTPICNHDHWRRQNGLMPRESVIVATFENTTATDEGFYSLVQPVRVMINHNYELDFAEVNGYPLKITLDLTNNEQPLKLQRRNGDIIEPTSDNLYQAFSNIQSLKSFTRVLATARTRSLFLAMDKVARNYHEGARARDSLAWFVNKFRGIEPFWQAGFSPANIATLPFACLQATSGPLHQRLNVPRRFVDLIKDEILSVDDYPKLSNFVYNYLNLSQPAFHNSGVWDMVEPMRIHCQSAMSWLPQAFLLVYQHGYDSQNLLDYITVNARDYQGIVNPIEAIHLLSEYADMTDFLGDGNKYPQYLKVAYDMACSHIIAAQDEQLNKEFINVVSDENYQRLCGQLGQYQVIAPQSIADMQYEGAYLAHSVAQLSRKVASQYQDNKVYFLRKINDIDTPLITLNCRFGYLYQAHGYRNRAVNNEERLVIQNWASQHGLDIWHLVL